MSRRAFGVIISSLTIPAGLVAVAGAVLSGTPVLPCLLLAVFALLAYLLVM
jgi:hypothetical protein